MQLTHPIHQAFSRGFYSDSGRDYEVRLLLGYCTSGGADAGEVLATIDALDSGHEQAWADAWLAAGRRVAGAARDSFAHGHRESAASAYLRAANYLSTAFDGLDGVGTETQRMTVFAEHRAAWDGFVGAGSFAAHRLSIPYDGTTMPGWLVRPADDDRPRPTLVLVNGSDGSISALWCAAGHAALTRGYNVVLFDGPGQQSMLFEKSVLFRPDWEAALTPVTDTVIGQPGVDAQRLAVYGISQAGFWVPQALSVEHRYRAAVVDPGVVDVSASWTTHLPKSLVAMLDDSSKARRFDQEMALGLTGQKATQRMWAWRARPYGHNGQYFDTMREVMRYRLDADAAAAITTPMLITAPEHEQFWPGQSARLATMLTGTSSTVVDFTAAEGASWHCQPMGRAVTAERIFDWLDDALEVSA